MTEENLDNLPPDKMRTTVKFNKKQFKKIKRMQKIMGVSLPSLLKEALFKTDKWEQPLLSVDDVNHMMAEMRKQGADLNKMSAIVNEGLRCGWNDSFNALTQAYVDLRHLLCRFREGVPKSSHR